MDLQRSSKLQMIRSLKITLFFMFLFQESNAEGSPRHSLGSNNSSNFSSPPSPAREHGSSSYESWIQKQHHHGLFSPSSILAFCLFLNGFQLRVRENQVRGPPFFLSSTSQQCKKKSSTKRRREKKIIITHFVPSFFSSFSYKSFCKNVVEEEKNNSCWKKQVVAWNTTLKVIEYHKMRAYYSLLHTNHFLGLSNMLYCWPSILINQ